MINKELVFNALVYMKQQSVMSLEEAIQHELVDPHVVLSDEAQLIRDFLVFKGLLKHNPRLTYLGVHHNVGGIDFVSDDIVEGFVDDYLTEDCIYMIDHGLLRDYIFENNHKKIIFLYVGHSNWGKSAVLRHITDNNSKKKVKGLFGKVFRVRKMSNDDNEEKLLKFAHTISGSCYNYYLLAYCPKQLRVEKAKEILSILSQSGDLYFFVQKQQFRSNLEIEETDIADLSNYGLVEVMNGNIEYTERTMLFLDYVKRVIEISEK